MASFTAGSAVQATASHSSVDIRSVSKTYESRNGRVQALESTTFTVGSGEFVALVGPSGCGKSTLLKLVAGLIHSDTGLIDVAGAPARAGRREVGIMFQSPTLFPWRTVLENVLLPTEVFDIRSTDAVTRARRILSLVGLTDFEEKYPWELSGGMQQRVNLSRLLVCEPLILLMDEPFGALDEFTRERLNLEITELHQRLKRTVLYVTHNISEAVFLADRVVVMTNRPGRVLGVVESDLPRPRTVGMIDSPELAQQVRGIRRMLHVERLAIENDGASGGGAS